MSRVINHGNNSYNSYQTRVILQCIFFSPFLLLTSTQAKYPIVTVTAIAYQESVHVHVASRGAFARRLIVRIPLVPTMDFVPKVFAFARR